MIPLLQNKQKISSYNPGSKEKLGQRRSYIASVVGMTLATNDVRIQGRSDLLT